NFDVRQHGRRAGVAAGPLDRDAIDLRLLPQTERHHQLALAQVAARARDLAPLLHPAALEDYMSANRTPVTPLSVAFQPQPNPVMPRAVLVSQESCRPSVGRQYDVGRAVAVEVEVGAAPADERLEQVASGCGGGHQPEARLAPAAVPEQL